MTEKLFDWDVKYQHKQKPGASSRDTDSNKSSDFLLNPVCIMLLYILLCYFVNVFPGYK